MKVLTTVIIFIILFFFDTQTAFAAGNNSVAEFTKSTLNLITIVSSSAVIFFLIRGAYLYITSTGKPDMLDHAKKTITNALIGLALILGSTVIVTLLTNAFTPESPTQQTTPLALTPITTAPVGDGMTQAFLDMVNGAMQQLVQGGTKPVVDAILGYITQTPSVLQNATIHNFWLVMLGITDSFYIFVIALIGLHIMSATTFGFDDVEIKHLLPRIGLSFLCANVSLFLVDYVIQINNVLVASILSQTGGLNHAWIVNTVTFPNIVTNNTRLLTLIFFLLFLIIATVLLLLYISRLILISLAAVISPFIFLLFALPKFTDFAEIATKVYIVTVFIEFVHVVIIQLASSFLALPDHQDNSLLAVIVAIGLFATLLRMPSLMMHMVFYTTRTKLFQKIGGQLLNVSTAKINSMEEKGANLERKTVNQ